MAESLWAPQVLFVNLTPNTPLKFNRSQTRLARD
jgi:hypothetical protein